MRRSGARKRPQVQNGALALVQAGLEAVLVDFLRNVENRLMDHQGPMDIFPENLALAATFNTDLAAEVSKELAKEYRALGVITLLRCLPAASPRTGPAFRCGSGP